MSIHATTFESSTSFINTKLELDNPNTNPSKYRVTPLIYHYLEKGKGRKGDVFLLVLQRVLLESSPKVLNILSLLILNVVRIKLYFLFEDFRLFLSLVSVLHLFVLSPF